MECVFTLERLEEGPTPRARHMISKLTIVLRICLKSCSYSPPFEAHSSLPKLQCNSSSHCDCSRAMEFRATRSGPLRELGRCMGRWWVTRIKNKNKIQWNSPHGQVVACTFLLASLEQNAKMLGWKNALCFYNKLTISFNLAPRQGMSSGWVPTSWPTLACLGVRKFYKKTMLDMFVLLLYGNTCRLSLSCHVLAFRWLYTTSVS